MRFKNHHTAISVRDIDQSMDFYQKFGFKVVLEWEAEDNSLKIAHLKLDKYFLEIFCYSSFEIPDSLESDLGRDLKNLGVKHFGLKVKSIEKAKFFVEENDIAKNVEIKEGRTGVTYFFIKDPDGFFLEILEDKRKL